MNLRRQACFDLVACGYSHHEIAAAIGVSLAAVQRDIDTALADRPLEALDGNVRLQVARLTKALSDAGIPPGPSPVVERGDAGRPGHI